MFRSDRDALATEVEDLRREREALVAENERLRSGVLAARAPVPQFRPNVYKAGPGSLGEDERIALMRVEVEATPVWAAVLLHFVTFGLFSFVQFNRLHGALPQIEKDDPTPAKAIGFSFIPYLNLYWLVWNPLRLTDRVNFQFALRGRPDAVPRGLMMACAVISVIPYANLFVGLLLLWPFAVYYLQRATNELAVMGHEAPHPVDRVEAEWPAPARVSLGADATTNAEVEAAELEAAEREADEAVASRFPPTRG